MGYDPDSAIDIAQDLPRAVAYSTWAKRFQRGGAPDGITAGADWGHVARWLATKAAKDPTLRAAGVTGSDLLTMMLASEAAHQGSVGFPSYAGGQRLGANARGNQTTLRGMLLWGFNQSADRNLPTWGGASLAQQLARTIETDPDPGVRLEALRAIKSAGYFPVGPWASVFIPALRNAQATLAETPFNQTARSALQKQLAETEGRFMQLVAEIPAGVAPPNPPAWYERVNWAAVAIGLGVVTASGIGWHVYRQRQARRLPA